jgi:MFS family permease
MSRKLFMPLFTSNLLIFTIGNGLLPLLPVFSSSFEVGSSMIGIYLAITYLALAAGTFLTGWAASRFNNRRLYIAAGLSSLASFFLLGFASQFWQAVLLTSSGWLFSGIQITLINIQTGRLADPAVRGKTFSMMYLARPVGAVLGGLLIGRLVEALGYGGTFQALAILVLLTIPMGWMAFNAKTEAAAGTVKKQEQAKPEKYATAFVLFLFIVLLINTALFTGRLGTSLSMQSQVFSPSAISSTSAIGGLLSIPFVFLFGGWSDRFGRKPVLVLSFAFGLALFWLATASALWSFVLVSAGISIANYAGAPVASAMATDMLTKRNLGKGLALMNAMQWGAAIPGFAVAGFLIDLLGQAPVYFYAAVMLFANIALLVALNEGRSTARPFSGASLSSLLRNKIRP